MIVGDLNADCRYVSNTKYNSLDLILNASFTWWIDKSDDTTTSASNCAYDGIITYSSLTPFVINSSVEIVLFDQKYNLSAEFTSDVSDHYPIKVTIKGTTQSSSFTVVTPTESPTSSSLELFMTTINPSPTKTINSSTIISPSSIPTC